MRASLEVKEPERVLVRLPGSLAPQMPALTEPAKPEPARPKDGRFMAALTLLVAMAALAVSGFVAYRVAGDAEYRRAERVERAWNLLLRRAGGNTGKASAFNELWSSGVLLDGLDLSCRNVGEYDLRRRRCVAAPRFIGLSLDYFDAARAARPAGGSDARLGNAEVRTLNLSGAVVERARLSRVSLRKARLHRTAIRDSVLDGARLEGSFRGMRIARSSLVNSWIEGDIRGMSIEGSEVSGLTFTDFAPGRRPALLRDSWAWADMPPSQFDTKSEDDDGALRPLPAKFLAGVRLCMPPMDKDGDVLPPEARRPSSQQNSACQEMSLEASKWLFPEVYGFNNPRFR